MKVGRLLSFSRAVDRFNIRIGNVIAWAILIAVVVSAVNAIIRKVLNTASNSWLELQWILFGAVFLFCARGTVVSNEHIRMDRVKDGMPNGWVHGVGEYG